MMPLSSAHFCEKQMIGDGKGITCADMFPMRQQRFMVLPSINLLTALDHWRSLVSLHLAEA